MASVTSAGIGSGLDIEGLVTQLVAAESGPPTQRLDKREAVLQVRLSAFGTLKSATASLQSSLASLTTISSYRVKTADSSDSDILSATATDAAALGDYSINVTQLSAKHSVALDPTNIVNARFTEVTDVLGTGSLTFKFGTTVYDSGSDIYTSFTQNIEKASKTVEITDGSIKGIRDAVNNADIGVTASIVFDGTYQNLVFSSDSSGADNSLQIVADDADDTDADDSGLSLLAFNDTATNLVQTQAAQDATLKINGIAITSSEDKVAGVLEGVTLNLKDIGTSTLTVDASNDAAGTAVNDFVSNLNGLLGTINNLTSYDPETKQAGQLNGDAIVRSIEGRIRQLIGTQLKDINSVFSVLGDIGITVDATTGLYNVDAAKLDSAIENNLDSVISLFAAYATPTDSNITFDSATSVTTAGNYNVSIDQLATKGSLVGSAAANLTIVTGTNDTISIKVDGVTADITLTAGVHTEASLIAELQSQINAVTELTAVDSAVTVSANAGVFTIESNRYGSTSKVEIIGGNGSTDLVGASATNTDGVDVEGSIGGIVATGSGQFLTGAGGATGLKLKIDGGLLGDRGSVSFSRGLADRLDSYLGIILSDDGIFESTTDALDGRIDDIADDRELLKTRLETIEKRIRNQFIALDALLSTLQSTSSFLTQQLANLPEIKVRSSN